MADEKKTYLVNVESNLDKYAADAAKARDEVDKLTAENIKLKGSSTASKEEIEKSNSALRASQKEYTQAKKLVDLQTTANNSNINSRKQLNAIVTLEQQRLGKLANAYVINEKGVRVLSQSYIEQVKRLKEAKDAVIGYDKAQGDGRSSVGLYSEAIEGSAAQFSAIPGPIGQAGAAVSRYSKILMANPIVLVITAIVAAVTGLVKVFKTTDSGATELEVRMEQLKAAIDRVRLSVINLINWMKKQITVLSEWRDEFEKNHKVISKVYEVITTIINPIKQLRFVINQVKELLPGTTAEFEKLAKAARDYTESMDTLTNAEQNYVSQSAENRNKIAKLEYTAQDATKSVEVRRQALKGAIKIGEEEVNAQKKFAEDRLNIEATYLAEKNGLRAEDVIAFTKMTDAEQANASDALKLLRDNNEDKIIEIEEYYANILDLDTQFFTEQKRNISKLSGFENQVAKEQAEKDLQIKKDAALTEIERLRSLINEKKIVAIQLAEEIGADVLGIQEKYAAAEVELAKLTADQKVDLWLQATGSIAQLFGENTAIGKAAAIAQVTISTYAAAQKSFEAYALIPGPAKWIAAGAAIVSGMANIKKIISVKSGLPGDGGASAPAISIPRTITETPAAQRNFAAQVPSSFVTQPQLSQTQLNVSSGSTLTAADIAAEIMKIPAPIVTVEDINAKTKSVHRVEVRATI